MHAHTFHNRYFQCHCPAGPSVGKGNVSVTGTVPIIGDHNGDGDSNRNSCGSGNGNGKGNGNGNGDGNGDGNVKGNGNGKRYL